MKAFIFFTNREKLTTSQVKVEADKLRGFGPSENLIMLSSDNKKLDFDSATAPYFIIISDERLSNPGSDGKEQGNALILKKILNKVNEIYIVLHQKSQQNHFETLERIFSDKIRDYIHQSHDSNSVYNTVLKPALTEDNTDLTRFEKILLQEFNNKEKELLIALGKEARLLDIKLRLTPGTEGECIKELKLKLSGLEDKLKIQMPEVSSLISGLTVENYRNNMEKIWEIIDDTINDKKRNTVISLMKTSPAMQD